jgi:DNA-binding MarR family transcriptional regulator
VARSDVDAQADEIIDLVGELVARVWGHFTARAAELGLSVPEAKALGALEPDDDVSMRTLAARVHANPSNITVVVARLEGRGLITRRSAGDRRVKGVRLTQSGLAMRQRLTDRIATEHPAVHGLSANQREAFLRILRRLHQQ